LRHGGRVCAGPGLFSGLAEEALRSIFHALFAALIGQPILNPAS
jgi:hypothetical protein